MQNTPEKKGRILLSNQSIDHITIIEVLDVCKMLLEYSERKSDLL